MFATFLKSFINVYWTTGKWFDYKIKLQRNIIYSVKCLPIKYSAGAISFCNFSMVCRKSRIAMRNFCALSERQSEVKNKLTGHPWKVTTFFPGQLFLTIDTLQLIRLGKKFDLAFDRPCLYRNIAWYETNYFW